MSARTRDEAHLAFASAPERVVSARVATLPWAINATDDPNSAPFTIAKLTSERPVSSVMPAAKAPGVTCWTNTEKKKDPARPTKVTRHTNADLELDTGESFITCLMLEWT